MNKKSKTVAICGLFIALSFILSNVKIAGSVAFDSMPAFAGGILLGGGYGALIGALGHLLTAALSGFTFTVPVHLMIAGLMALTVFAFTITYNKIKSRFGFKLAALLGTLVGTALNGPLQIVVLWKFLFPIMGSQPKVLYGFMVVLSVAAAANMVLALVVVYVLEKRGITWER